MKSAVEAGSREDKGKTEIRPWGTPTKGRSGKTWSRTRLEKQRTVPTWIRSGMVVGSRIKARTKVQACRIPCNEMADAPEQRDKIQNAPSKKGVNLGGKR